MSFMGIVPGGKVHNFVATTLELIPAALGGGGGVDGVKGKSVKEAVEEALQGTSTITIPRVINKKQTHQFSENFAEKWKLQHNPSHFRLQ